MIAFAAIPMPYRIAAGFAAAVIIAAIGFAYGVSWNADDLADAKADLKACQSTVRLAKEESNALKAENELIRRQSERAIKQTSDGWAAAVDYLRGQPVRVRYVRSACDTGAGAGVSAPAGEPAQAAGEHRSGAGRGEAAEISIEEINDRLNKAAKDAAQILWMLEHDASQAESHKSTLENSKKAYQ